MNINVFRLHMIEYQTFEKAYTHFILSNLKGNCSREEAYYKAQYQLQEYVMDYTFTHMNKIISIQAAYTEIKNDLATITRAAYMRYDLANCDNEIRARYMPLATL